MPNLITAATLCERLGGISKMTLHRILNDERERMPRPIIIRNIRYWKEEDLASWLAEREALTDA